MAASLECRDRTLARAGTEACARIDDDEDPLGGDEMPFR